MRKIVALILSLVLFTSCSVLKKVSDGIGLTESGPKIEKKEKSPEGIRIIPQEWEKGGVIKPFNCIVIFIIVLIVLLIIRKILAR
tara:strand:+ start:4341 stop:4595 length:255 start_codon:yes stop_codon:yes gene_type:complete